jgi:hypothetical protein
MVTKRTDYTAEAVEAARSVMLELSRILGEYQNDMVIVGGWVPELLIENAPRAHIGSLDVDVALNHRTLHEVGYKTILQLLLSHGYRQSEQPFIFFRTVEIGGHQIEVEIDFLAGEYSGTARGHRTQRVQDMRPRKARGCDLALSLAIEIHISGTLPGGAKDTATLRVASIVPFLVMKAMTLASRLMEKDAWDIYYCIRYYPGGIEKLVEEFTPHLANKLVQEAIANIAEKFASPAHVGPTHVADFDDITNPEDRAIVQRDAFERVQALLIRLQAINP